MEDVTHYIALRIVQLREIKGWSTNKLANVTGVSQSYLRSIEMEDKNLTIEILFKLCKALDISLRDFFDEELVDNDKLFTMTLNKRQGKALKELIASFQEM